MSTAKLSAIFSLILLIVLTNSSPLSAQATNGSKDQAARLAQLPYLSVLLLLPGQELTGNAADGLAAYFCNDFEDSIGEEDSYKFTNPDENIGIVRNNSILCLEGRKMVTGIDTLPLKMWKLYQTQYKFKIEMGNFSAGIRAYLQDSYLNTTLELPSNGQMLVSFTVNAANSASIAPNRFSVVLKKQSTLPVHLTGIKAFQNDRGLEVKWNAENESEIDHYEIEQSLNAQAFVTAGSVRAKNNSAFSTSYSWNDMNQVNADRYFRVKSIEKSGEIQYTPIVKVESANTKRQISITSNSAQGNSVTLSFKNADKGTYQLSLVNYGGQKVFAGTLYSAGGTESKVLNINNRLLPGIYSITMVHANSRETIPFVVM